MLEKDGIGKRGERIKSRCSYAVRCLEGKRKFSSSTETTMEAQEEDAPSDDQSEPSLSLETTEDQGFLENEADESHKEPILQPSTQQEVKLRTVGYTKPKNVVFDIGMSSLSPTSKEIEEMVRQGHLPHPKEFLCDIDGKHFPSSVLNAKKVNANSLPEDGSFSVPPRTRYSACHVDCSLMPSNIQLSQH